MPKNHHLHIDMTPHSLDRFMEPANIHDWQALLELHWQSDGSVSFYSRRRITNITFSNHTHMPNAVILRLNRPVQLGVSVQPVCTDLEEKLDLSSASSCWITGWEKSRIDGSECFVCVWVPVCVQWLSGSNIKIVIKVWIAVKDLCMCILNLCCKFKVYCFFGVVPFIFVVWMHFNPVLILTDLTLRELKINLRECGNTIPPHHICTKPLYLPKVNLQN